MIIIPPDFTPICYEGMSFVTAICLSFGGTVLGLIVWFFRREIARLDKRIDEQTQSMRIFSQNMVELRTDIAVVQESIDNIEKMMADLNRNMKDLMMRR